MLISNRTRQRLLIMVGFIIVLIVGGYYQPATHDVESPGVVSAEAAFEDQLSDVQLEVTGEVSRLLPDDNKGSRHQRFIVRLTSGRTVLVAHNIDLAPRIDDLAVGDKVSIYGEYVWNNKGGIMHWTHHDPANRHPHGWIRHQGTLYQ